MQDVRRHVDVKLVNKWEGRYGAQALIAKPNFHSYSIFEENLVAIQLTRTEIKMRMPIYVGFSILDISKTCLYRFHYDYMRENIGEDFYELCYTDTDSLIYLIREKNIYEIMKRDIHEFDTSTYPQPNRFNIPCANKAIPGLMKDENNGSIFTEVFIIIYHLSN